MEDEEREMQIKSVKITGIVVMAVMILMSISLVVLGATFFSTDIKRFVLFIVSAGAGVITAAATGLTLVRVDKLKSRKSLMIGGACMLLSIIAMLVLALIALLKDWTM